jgi:hypothetical protein
MRDLVRAITAGEKTVEQKLSFRYGKVSRVTLQGAGLPKLYTVGDGPDARLMPALASASEGTPITVGDFVLWCDDRTNPWLAGRLDVQ